MLSWVMSRVREWRRFRDDNHKSKWEEYYRIWRGVYSEEDKSRESERSRLISPATQQAVEGAVAEMEEATFGREIWFDIKDDVVDQENKQTDEIEEYRKRLKEDLEKEKIKKRVSEAMLNGALYGTGIGEIIVEEKTELYPDQKEIPGTLGVKMVGSSQKKYVCVRLNPISPFNFCSDPGVQDIDDALGCAIDEVVPKHQIIAGIKNGIYRDVPLDNYQEDHKDQRSGEKRVPTMDKVKITRYYGLVPEKLLNDEPDETTANQYRQDQHSEEAPQDEEGELVEAIVIIANDSQILKAERSPYMMQDRPIVAYQHDTVPGRFHGRGVVEKGYNVQKALDTELRARQDGLALTNHPMMAIDATRLPRGVKPKVYPGATILTNGNPKEILMPFNFGQANPTSYKESAELERMVTMATGTMDTAAPMGVNPRNSTSSGMSMMLGASIKRQKRTLANFQECFLIPMIRKCLYRFMQFDPERYPVKDLKFTPTSTMGIMAREYEQQQRIQLMSMLPPGSPPFNIILQSYFDSSADMDRGKVIAAIEEMSKPKPPSPAEQVQQQQVQMQVKASEMKMMADGAELQFREKEMEMQAAELALKQREVAIAEKRLEIEAGKLALEELKIHNDTGVSMAKIAVEQQNNRMDYQTNKHG